MNDLNIQISTLNKRQDSIFPEFQIQKYTPYLDLFWLISGSEKTTKYYIYQVLFKLVL